MIKVVIQNTSTLPIQKESIAIQDGATFTSPQNFQPYKKLTLGETFYLYYDKPFKVIRTGNHIQVVPADGKGWHKDTPGHKRAAAKGKLKSTLRKAPKPNEESAEEIAARHIKNAPNDLWNRPYKIRSVRNIITTSEGQKYYGVFILIEYTEPLIEKRYQETYDFAGAYIINIPKIYLDESHPVLFYHNDNDSWERREDNIYHEAKRKAQHHTDHVKCSACGSYRPPKITHKSGGEELIWITSTCKDCGHKEVEPFD